VLAELLHTPVYELRNKMPISEYRGWQQYITKKNKQMQDQSNTPSDNLLDSEETLLKGLGIYG
jgi:hypothetical protein